jgi:hypothetical protein
MYLSFTPRPIDLASEWDMNPTRALESRSSKAFSCFPTLTWAASSLAVRVQRQTLSCFNFGFFFKEEEEGGGRREEERRRREVSDEKE